MTDIFTSNLETAAKHDGYYIHGPRKPGRHMHSEDDPIFDRHMLLAQNERLRASLQIARDELVQYIDFQCKSDYLEYAAESQKKLDVVNAALSGDSSAPETKPDDGRDAERYRYLRERSSLDRYAVRERLPNLVPNQRILREAELDRELDECIGLTPAQETTSPHQPDPRGDAALWVLAWLAMKGGLGLDVHEMIDAVMEGRAEMRPGNRLHIEPKSGEKASVPPHEGWCRKVFTNGSSSCNCGAEKALGEDTLRVAPSVKIWPQCKHKGCLLPAGTGGEYCDEHL